MAVPISKIIKASDKFHPHVTYLIFKCLWCFIEFERMESYFNKLRKRKKNTCTFCSRSCRSKWIASIKFPKGSKHPKWKGGKSIDTTGYTIIYNPNHPNNLGGKYVREHRLVMEKKIGRFLTSNEFVHHKNGNKTDNRLENLEIISQSDHSKLHGKIRDFLPTFKARKHRLESRNKMRLAKLGKKRDKFGHWIFDNRR